MTLDVAVSLDNQYLGKQIRKVAPERTEKKMSVHEVIRQHHNHLLVWLRGRLSIPDDAYDVAQEAYIRLLKYEGSDDIRSPLAILQKIALNVAYDMGRVRRSRNSDQHYSIDDNDIVTDDISPERIVAAREDLKTVITAIEGLPSRCRQVFLLSRVRGMSYPEIAEHCGISVKMVEKHVSHALFVCMQRLKSDT